MEDLKELRRKKMLELPEDLREALLSFDTTDKIMAIGKRQQLHLDVINEMGQLIGLVILGEVKAGDFPRELQKKLSLPPEKVDVIVRDVDEQIFKNIRESLKKFADTIPNKQTTLPGDVTATTQQTRSFEGRGSGVLSVNTAGSQMKPAQPNRPAPSATPAPKLQQPAKPPLANAIPARPSTTPVGKQALADAIAAIQKAPEAPVRPEQTPAAPAVKPIEPQTSTPKAPSTAIPQLRTLPQDIAAAKLSGMTQNKAEEKKIPPAPVSDPSKPKTDPYREPLS